MLQDDRHYFPPYEAVAVMRRETVAHHPEVGRALDELAGKISDQDMQQMNYEIDGKHRDIKEVVKEFLQRKDCSEVGSRQFSSAFLAVKDFFRIQCDSEDKARGL